MPRSLHSKYTPFHKEKYDGDWRKIQLRSSWERALARWADHNPKVRKWNSEEVIIPYICPTDMRQHRYYIDFMIEFVSGQKFLIEIKPEYQTIPPQPGKRKTRQFITEALTYAKNDAKWKAATEYANKNGYHFEIWTEKSLQKIGIPMGIPKRNRKKK